MSSKHSLWLGWVVGNEDIAADKIDKILALMDHTC